MSNSARKSSSTVSNKRRARSGASVKTAWLVTWESIGDHAAVQQPILAILNHGRSPDSVKQFVEDSYASHSYGLEEKLSVATDRGRNPYRAKFGDIGGVEWLGDVVCGHNPWLHARKVRTLHAEQQLNADESGGISLVIIETREAQELA